MLALPANASGACRSDLCVTPEVIHGTLADSDGDGAFDSSFKAERLDPDFAQVSLVSFAGTARWSLRLPSRDVFGEGDLPPTGVAGDFTGDRIADYVFTGRASLEPASQCGPFVETWSVLYFVNGATGQFSTPLPPITNKCWDFPNAQVTYPTHRYPGFVQIGDFSESQRGNEVVVEPTYPPDDRGWVLNFEQLGAWAKVTGRDGANSLVHASSPDFGSHYNEANPEQPCKKPLTITTCHVPDSHVPTGLIINSQGKRELFVMTTGRALLYRDDLTPTADTVWSSGNTANGGRNYGRLLFFSHEGKDYASLIGGCSVRAARTAMKLDQPPDGRRETSLGGADAHCSIHHHYEWFEIEGDRITRQYNRYYSYSVSDGFFHNRPEFPGNPLGPIGGPGTNWVVYNLFDGPKESTGEGEWGIELMQNPADPTDVRRVTGWFVWDVVDLDRDGRAELLATRSPARDSPRPYVLPWEVDVLEWNGSELESIYHRDGVAPTLLLQPATAANRADGGAVRNGSFVRDLDGDGVAEILVEDRDGNQAYLRVPSLARLIPDAGGDGGGGGPAVPTTGAAPVQPAAPSNLADTAGSRTSLFLSTEAVRLNSKGVARIAISCFGPKPCAGEVNLRTARRLRRGGKAQRVAVGSRRFKLPTGRRSAIRVRISNFGRGILRSNGKLPVSARAELPRAAGAQAYVTHAAFELLPPR